MKSIQRISELRTALWAMQSELGKGHITDAQAVAAKIDYELEEWGFDLMRIPRDDRHKCRSVNGFYHHDTKPENLYD